MRSVALLEAFANKKVQKCITLILSGTDSYISVKFGINKLIRKNFHCGEITKQTFRGLPVLQREEEGLTKGL